MKQIRRFLDSLEPYFDPKEGKFGKLYPLYEAADTFFFSPADATTTASHVRDSLDLKRMMGMVVIALLPCVFMAFWNTGYQANLALQQIETSAAPGWRGAVIELLGSGYDPGSFYSNIVHGGIWFLPIYITCMITGGFWEVLFSIVRKHDVNEGFLVTGLLLPLTLPPTIPLWEIVLGTSFGVVIGKEVFGGTGMNFLNPALTARAFLYFSYPAQLSGNTMWTAVDGYSSATTLASAASAPVGHAVSAMNVTWMQAFLGTIPGSMGETSVLACLIGAAILIVVGIGSWRIMSGVLIGSVGLSTLFWMIGSETNAMFELGPHWHLVIGGLAFGLVFMATDPVSAAMTAKGKWIYGIMIGAMTIMIRVVNPAFHEGVMLAILFGNVFAPLIDYFVVQANIKRRLARNVA